MKTPEHIKHDMKYYKFENHFLCHNCNQYAAKFTYLKFHDDRIHWLFNCTRCGEDFKYMMTFDKLLELYFQYTGASDKTQVERYWLWECYRLGLYFDTVFQHETDKIDYNNIICKLNKDTSGWRGYWYRWKYAA
jgi:transcription elongation factor Elf1